MAFRVVFLLLVKTLGLLLQLNRAVTEIWPLARLSGVSISSLFIVFNNLVEMSLFSL
jgi:hypothetical protein